MTLHLHRGRCWPIVCSPYGVFITAIRGIIIGSVHSMLPTLAYPKWYTRLTFVHLVNQVPRGLHGKGQNNLYFNLVALCMLLRVEQLSYNLRLHGTFSMLGRLFLVYFLSFMFSPFLMFVPSGLRDTPMADISILINSHCVIG